MAVARAWIEARSPRRMHGRSRNYLAERESAYALDDAVLEHPKIARRWPSSNAVAGLNPSSGYSMRSAPVRRRAAGLAREARLAEAVRRRRQPLRYSRVPRKAQRALPLSTPKSG